MFLRNPNSGCELPVSPLSDSIAEAVRAVIEPLEGRVLLANVPGYTTSWVGDTFGASSSTQPKWTSNFVRDLHVASDGTVYSTSKWDEGGHEVSVYKNGDKLGALPNTHGVIQNVPAPSVTGNATYLYVAINTGVRRYNVSNRLQNGSDLAVSGDVRGLASSATELFVADNTNSRIAVYDATTMAFKRQWTLARPGKLAVDAAGYLWVIQDGDASNAPKVLRFNATGTLQAQSITFAGGVLPTDITTDGSSRVLITDNGPDQNVKIYNIASLTGTPTAVASTLGVLGGVFAGTGTQIGQAGPGRFNNPLGVGIDSSGNIYVGNDRNGNGMSIDSYSASGSSNWQVVGLDFEDAGDIDPANESVLLTKDGIYNLNYNNSTAGSEWSYAADTVDWRQYPNDPRYSAGVTGVFARRLNGRLYTFGEDQYSKYFAVTKFDPATPNLGKPSTLFLRNMGGTYPPNQPTAPSGSTGIWRDTDGDGQFDATGTDTWETWTTDNRYMLGWYVDDVGTVWKPLREGGLRMFPLLGFDANNNPIYTLASSTVVANPAPFTSGTNGGDLRRVFYDAASDTMYMTGFNAANPNPGNDDRGAGKVMACFPNWSTGNRTAAWTTIIPYSNTLYRPSGISVAGDYVFVTNFCLGNPTINRVFRASDGAYIGDMQPGPEVGGKGGDPDIQNGIRAYHRSNGEYIIIQSDHRYARQLLYRWAPDGTKPNAVTGLTPSVVSSSQINLTWTDNSGNETGFEIDLATNSAFTLNVVTSTVGASNTTFSATGLNSNTTYYFRVRATNAVGDSPNSATATATTQVEAIDFSGTVSGRYTFGATSGQVGRYQTFIATSNPTITGIDLMLRKRGGTAQSDVLVQLFAVTSNAPSGSALASATIASSLIGTADTIVRANLNYTGLINGAEYAIMLTQITPGAQTYEWATRSNISSLYNFGRWDGTSTYTDESGLGDAWMKIYLS